MPSNVIFCNFKSPIKACFFIFVTLLGIVAVSKLELLEKAESPIVITLLSITTLF